MHVRCLHVTACWSSAVGLCLFEVARCEFAFACCLSGLTQFNYCEGACLTCCVSEIAYHLFTFACCAFGFASHVDSTRSLVARTCWLVACSEIPSVYEPVSGTLFVIVTVDIGAVCIMQVPTLTTYIYEPVQASEGVSRLFGTCQILAT